MADQSRDLPHYIILRLELTNEENIEMDNKICRNAYKFKSNTLVIEFERILGYDVPKVDGILLFQGHQNGIVV
jgi:hypothetical protein